MGEEKNLTPRPPSPRGKGEENQEKNLESSPPFPCREGGSGGLGYSLFWRVIAARPDDDSPKLVLAKWFEDRSDPSGQCLRWVVDETKRPAFDRHDTKTWDWWSRTPADPLHYETSPHEYLLPLNLFTRLTPFGPGFWKGDLTFVAALQNLCSAWNECVVDRVDPLADDRPRPEADAGLAAESGANV